MKGNLRSSATPVCGAHSVPASGVSTQLSPLRSCYVPRILLRHISKEFPVPSGSIWSQIFTHSGKSNALSPFACWLRKSLTSAFYLVKVPIGTKSHGLSYSLGLCIWISVGEGKKTLDTYKLTFQKVILLCRYFKASQNWVTSLSIYPLCHISSLVLLVGKQSPLSTLEQHLTKCVNCWLRRHASCAKAL